MERFQTAQTPPPVAEIPLFPLDAVLFPHMPLPLHIFEERYREMVNRCLQENRPFGVVLITSGVAEGGGPATTRAVGCTARISHVERLHDGRMNILVVGGERFRILRTDESLPYRTGLTQSLRDAPSDAALVVPLADEVHKLLRDFLTRSLALAGQPIETFDLPDEPEQLSFAAACMLPLDNDEKQALLENTDTAARLAAEKEVLRREVIKLHRAAAAQAPPRPVAADAYAAFRCEN
uniref:Uncharacterized protein, similar to the N-terminal domain of Lon protease n=1 Tax=uncultured Armatimonadetes bacterium TaxID=157466 RepID=A0A6J4IT92_9BACT|nr:Uncharacterized protein, similar to the N-terminal domain of Lon protease [uncultured Armatimonadetes bacterium]